MPVTVSSKANYSQFQTALKMSGVDEFYVSLSVEIDMKTGLAKGMDIEHRSEGDYSKQAVDEEILELFFRHHNLAPNYRLSNDEEQRAKEVEIAMKVFNPISDSFHRLRKIEQIWQFLVFNAKIREIRNILLFALQLWNGNLSTGGQDTRRI